MDQRRIQRLSFVRRHDTGENEVRFRTPSSSVTLALITLALATPLLLQGCAAPLLVAGAAAGVAITQDKRPPGVVLEDERLESRIASAVNGDRSLARDVNVSVTSYHQVVLLTGQVPDEATRQRVLAHLRGIEQIRRIHDHLAIAPPSQLGQRSRDTMITARVKSALAGENGFPSAHLKIVTERDTVYLMGRVRRDDAARIGAIVQGVEGVKLIVFVFEYLA